LYFRKSVIVNQIFNEEVILNEQIDQVVEEVEGCENDGECIKIANSLTIKEVQNIFTLEEEAYFKKMTSSFYEHWKVISYGPEVMEFYIDFCRNPKTLSEIYFTENNKVTR
jgi:hypothetical protein